MHTLPVLDAAAWEVEGIGATPESPEDGHVSGVLVVALGGADADSHALAEVEQYLSGGASGPPATFRRFDRAGMVRVPLSPGEHPSALLRGVGERVQRWLRLRMGEPPWIGMSRTATSRDAIHRGIDEARGAVELGRRYFPKPRVLLAEDVLSLAVVEASPSARASLAAILRPLTAYDRKVRGQLVRTLEAYLGGSLSVMSAARALEVHRHTIEQRVKRIERILGRDLSDGQDRLLLELAVVARRLELGLRERRREADLA